MKQFLKMRVLPVLLVFSLLSSFCVVPVAAADRFPSEMRDYDSVSDWESRLSLNAVFVSTAFECLNAVGIPVSADSASIFWALVNRVVSPEVVGPVHYGALQSSCESYNYVFNTPPQKSFFAEIFAGRNEIANDCLAFLLLGTLKLNFVVKRHPETNVQRIYEEVTGIWVVDSAGRYPYVESPSDTAAGNQWVDTSRVLSFLKTDTAIPDPFSTQALENLCANLVADNIQCRVMQISTKYKAICTNDGDFVYCNADGQPFVSFVDEEEWVVNDDREDTIVKDENGNVIEGLPEDVSSGIDLEHMLIYLPNGTIGLIDNLTYDESTKTYNVDSHDVYNNYYYYHYEYHINYTSITYIGQTEEYDKYYEVYYELPDGRDSADLTKEDLEQLNVSVDVIPYGRSTDNTSLRSLYHFDGDTRDASYWNYSTDFVWNKGASLTYMEAGAFEGALYLDENEHEFTLQLPSDIGSGDFTLQYRIYQSHTAAPVTDSYISFGSVPLLQWSGGYWLDPDDTALHVTPTGTWNEVALIRDSGTVYYYLNGVCMGSYASTAALNDHITFFFGDEQQTFKHLDELRVLDYALVEAGESYTPSAVPHDTNLALVVPTDAVPVADEYYVFGSSKQNLVNGDFSTGELPEGFVSTGAQLKDSTNHLAMGIYRNLNVESYSHFTRIIRSGSSIGTNTMYPGSCIYIPVAWANSLKITSGFAEGTPLVFSIVLADGSVYSLPVNVFRLAKDNVEMEIPGGVMGFESLASGDGSNRNIVAYIRPDSDSYIDFLYIELIEGTETDLTAEWVESIIPIDKDSLNTPTLAVRTDLEITSHQIGGVRPSVPEKGMVWALVENQRITSLQIYNGQAWEGVDGRIWTGTRWIPASSYNIITLQDMYDIVDATPDYEYIYTESGFWSWWQKSWIAFTDQLFTALGSGGSGGSGADGGDGSNGLDGVDLDAQDPELIPEEEDSKTFWQFILLLIVGGKSVVSGVREISSGAVSSVPESMDTIVDAFDSGGLAVGVLDGSYLDPDAADLPQDDSGEAVLAEVEEVDPWRYR